MKRIKQMLGVTLLEIMLVLAIAAMVVVTSVKYYQSASISQQSNALLSLIQAISAASDEIAQGSTGYSAVANAPVASLMGLSTSTISTSTGGAVTLTGASATTYTVSITNVPFGVCNSVKTKLSSNPRFSSLTPATCAAGSNTLGYTYNSAL